MLADVKSSCVESYFQSVWEGSSRSARHDRFMALLDRQNNFYPSSFNLCAETAGFLSVGTVRDAFDAFAFYLTGCTKLPRMHRLHYDQYILEVMLPDAVELVLRQRYQLSSRQVHEVVRKATLLSELREQG